MSSFRDRMNPEAIRYPSSLCIKTLIVSGLTIDLFCALAAILSHGTVRQHVFDATVLGLLVGFKLLAWPREIVADQFGLHSLGVLALWNTHIAWHDVVAVRPSTEVPGVGARVFGLRNDTIEFESRDGKSRVVHTPHHPDRDRLLREPRLRGVTVDVSALP